jgi:hypothetical protein
VPDGYTYRVETDEKGRITERVYALDADREAIFRRMFAMALEGHGAPAVARALNREGHRTKDGKAWTRRRVQHTLKSPFYAGLVSQLGEKTGPGEYRRFSAPRIVGPGAWPAYVTPEEFHRIQSGMANRDRAAKGRKPEGQRTTRYALARLGVCDRCGERMYTQTSPYVRKDGTQRRSYVCANVRGSTGLCDQPPLDGVQIDAAVVQHLNRLFIDFDAWLEELARGAASQRDSIEKQLGAELDAQAKAKRREEALRERYIEATDQGGIGERAAFDAYQHVMEEREAGQERIRALQTALASEPDEPSTDAMLDVYNALSRAIRGDGTEGVGELNDRLRSVFEEFRLGRMDDGALGILPVLRPHAVEAYAVGLPVAICGDTVKPGDLLPPAVPLVLWTSA